jgi:putative ATPase
VTCRRWPNVCVRKPFTSDELLALLERARLQDPYLAQKNIVVQETEALLYLAGGDARKLLNILDLVVQSETSDPVVINNAKVKEYTQEKIALYDKATARSTSTPTIMPAILPNRNICRRS